MLQRPGNMRVKRNGHTAGDRQATRRSALLAMHDIMPVWFFRILGVFLSSVFASLVASIARDCFY